VLRCTRYPDLEREEGAWRRIARDGLVVASPGWRKRVRRSKFTADAADWIEVALSTLAILATVVPVGYSVWFGREWLGWSAVLALAGAAVCLGLGVTALAAASWRHRPALGVLGFLAAVALSAALVLPQVDLLRRPQPYGTGLDRFLPFSDGVTSTLLTAIPVLTILLILRALKSPETRRHVGTAWDVATFWPRPFHPLAPPPYAERAIPELCHRIRHLLDGKHAVLVEGHSQGAVITIAALAQLHGRLPPEQFARLSVITYGNPLRRLYLRWFPEYTRRLIDDLGIDAPGSGGDGTTRVPLVNFHRDTDPIGRNLYADRKDPREYRLADPPLDGHRRGDGEPLIRGHSHAGYVREHEFRVYSDAEIKRLARSTGEDTHTP
jgi:hypothetical protein